MRRPFEGNNGFHVLQADTLSLEKANNTITKCKAIGGGKDIERVCGRLAATGVRKGKPSIQLCGLPGF